MDPFDGKPLKMRSEGRGLIFYSIGPDFKDDNGKMQYPLPSGSKQSGDLLFRMGAAYDQAYLAPALSQLAATGNIDMIQRAIAVGADVNQGAPLVEAAEKGNDAVVGLLVEKGADMNALSDTPDQDKGKDKRIPAYREPKIGGMTALMASATKAQANTVALLIDMGADPNRENKMGRTALMLAPGTRIMRLMEWAEYEARTLSRVKKDIQVLNARIKELEGKGKGLFGGDEREKKLLQLQERLAKGKAHVRFLEQGGTSSQGSPQKKETPVATPSRAPMIKLLLEAGADIHAEDALGATPLLFAICEGDVEAAKILIDKGSDIHAKNNFGWSGLIIAKATGNRAMEKLLMDAGASMDEKDGKTVNQLAGSLERLESAEKRSLTRKKR